MQRGVDLEMSTEPVIKDARVGDLAQEAFARHADVHERELWLDGAARASVLHLGPGATLEPHRHPSGVHHVWVIAGSCTIGGRHARAGCYAFVPAGLEHSTCAGVEGCTLFYVLLPMIIESEVK